MADLSIWKITVKFDTSKIELGEDPISMEGPFDPLGPPPPAPKQLLIPQGISLIVFEVVTEPPGSIPEAQFPTYPIEWFTPTEPFNTPIAQPECFQVHWYNPRQCTVVDTNTALFGNQHPFNVVVAYENKTYGSDPVIVNQPPDT